jgi:WD40 repeat protein
MANIYKKIRVITAAFLFFCVVWGMDRQLPEIFLQKKVIQHRLGDCINAHKKITAMEFSPDGKFLVEVRRTSSKNDIVITDIDQNKEYRCGCGDNIICAFAINNEKIITGHLWDDKNNLFMWDLKTGVQIGNFSEQVKKEIDTKFTSIGRVAWHPFGSYFASVPIDSKFFLHDAATGNIKKICNQNLVGALQYSPSGDYLVSVSDKAIIFRDGYTGQKKRKPAIGALAVAWNPDSSNFVAVSHDKKDNVIVCDGTTGKIIRFFTDELLGRDGYYVERDVQFSKNGKYLITISYTYFDQRGNNITIRDGKTFTLLDYIVAPIIKETVAISYDSKYLVFGTKTKQDNITVYGFKERKRLGLFMGDSPKIIRWRPCHDKNQFVCVSSKKCDLTVCNVGSKAINIICNERFYEEVHENIG